ncbi:MAG: SRPBCC family protein [Flavobacteriales bacterium]|nr:SRPBCC family protein [Flavobacteriales bacterium]
MNIKGKEITVNKSGEYVFNFLSDFSNFEKIMPDNVSKFESNENGFVFALTGMPEVQLKLKNKTPNTQITLTSAKESLDFTLESNITEVDENTSQVVLEFNGKFNSFIKMMVEKPLTNFIKSLTDNLEKL